MSTIMAKTVDHVNQPGDGSHPDHRADDWPELVHALMHRLRSASAASGAAAEGAGLNGMEARVLGYFARHPGATQSELAAHSGRDKAQLARLVKELRARNLLDGTEDAADRRQLRLAPTAAGQQMLRAERKRRDALRHQAEAGLSPAEREQLRTLLLKLLAALDAPQR